MTATEALRFLQEDIHTTVVATLDEDGLPVTCAIDMMDADENGLYFLTAKGKNFYRRLKKTRYIALTGTRGKDTMSCIAVSVRGSVRELGEGPLPRLLKKNPYMWKIYPDAESQKALTVFQLYAGSGEWFDLSQKPIERFSFSFGEDKANREVYLITDACIGCRICEKVCPQSCVDFASIPAVIRQEHCLHCGNCMEICPKKAIVREVEK